MHAAGHVAALAVGAALVLLSWASVFTTLVVPRGFNNRWSSRIQHAATLPLRWRRDGTDYERLDRRLALQAPFALLALLVAWLVAFYVGFWLLLVGIGVDAATAARQSGSSLFTLGFAGPVHADGVVVSYVAAATGLIVVALQIGYLPTLYGAYNRRETLVALLDSRAGSPAWGPELLARHQLVDIVDTLPAFYDRWENWAADVAESHTNYPVLTYFRSPSAQRSWVVGLLAVLDSAALYLALSPEAAPSQARLCLRMGYTCLQEVAAGVRIPVNRDPSPEDPLDLTYDDFLLAVRHLEAVGFPLERDSEKAWPHFRGWRVNYEAPAYALAATADAPPALWSGGRRRGLPDVPPVRPRDRQPKRAG